MSGAGARRRAPAGRRGPRPHALVPCPRMSLRTRLNLVVAALSAAFLIVLIAAEVESARSSVREEIEAANRVASQLLGRLAAVYSEVGGPDLVLHFLQQLGRVRANEVSLQTATGEVLYRSPAATYKAGREAPAWFAHLARAAAGEVRVSAARRRAAGGPGAAFARRARRLGRHHLSRPPSRRPCSSSSTDSRSGR